MASLKTQLSNTKADFLFNNTIANLNQVSIETIVHNINKNFREKHAEFCSQLSGAEEFELKDEMWTFAVISMNLLESLNTAEFELNNNNCYLSIQNERLLNVLFQLAICFGIHYNLEDFIGNVLLIGHCIY